MNNMNYGHVEKLTMYRYRYRYGYRYRYRYTLDAKLSSDTVLVL